MVIYSNDWYSIFPIKGIEYAVAFIILSNIISELTSFIVLFCFLPKHIKIKKYDLFT